MTALKKEPGKDIWLWGGGDLFRSLLDLNLVDTVEVGVVPVVLGQGIPLLPSPARQTRLTLTSHQVYKKTGTVSLVYDVKPAVRRSAEGCRSRSVRLKPDATVMAAIGVVLRIRRHVPTASPDSSPSAPCSRPRRRRAGLGARRGRDAAALPGAPALRHERSAGHGDAAADYLKQVLEAEGIPSQTFALEPRAAEPRRAAQGQRQQAAAAHHGPHRRRQRRPEEVDASAVQRDARRRLRLRPRHRRRQGQRRRRADGDAAR